ARLLSPLGTVGIATLYELDLTRPLVEARARGEVPIREATESDFEQVAELADGQGTASRELRERVRRGSRCFVAKIGAEVVHYNWLAFGWADVLPIAPAGRFIVLN